MGFGGETVTFTASAVLATWIAVALLGLAVAALLQRVHQLERRLEQSPGAGATSSLVGRPLADVDFLPSDRPSTIFLLASSGCPTCHELLPVAARLRDDHGLDVMVVWLGVGPDESAVEAVPGLDHRTATWTDQARAAVRATPWAVVTDATGTVRAAGPAGSEARLVDLVAAVSSKDGRP